MKSTGHVGSAVCRATVSCLKFHWACAQRNVKDNHQRFEVCGLQFHWACAQRNVHVDLKRLDIPL
eukprot:677743-Pyramimonas_sp.AAC.1